MGPAMVLMFLTHFLILHSTQNLFAELTRFADRRFYDDWWNVTTWAAFYRKWNGLVHDFIHSYLYADLVEFAGVSKSVAMMLSFALSAVVHEYIVAASLGFFFPILFVLFGGPGIWFMQLTRGRKGRPWNIFMWVMLATGQGLMMVLYFRCARGARAQGPGRLVQLSEARVAGHAARDAPPGSSRLPRALSRC